MITGCEITFPVGAIERPVLMECIRAARTIWSQLVVEDANTGRLVSDNIAGVGEVFVYENLAVREAWNDDGPLEANLYSMIHVIAGNDRTTIIADNPSHPDLERILDTIAERFNATFRDRALCEQRW